MEWAPLRVITMILNNNEMGAALDENTPAEILQEIALKEKSALILSLYDVNLSSEVMPPQYIKSKSILCAVAKNPNTPPDILKELFNLCPIEVLSNISLSLIILENSCFLEEIYNTTSDNYTIFGMDNVPLFFEEWGANNNDISIRESAALKIKSALLLEKCSNDDNLCVRICVAENEHTPSHILEKLAFDKHKEVLEAIASNPSTPKNILSMLAKNKNLKIRSNVAGNTNTPEEVLELLVKSKSIDIREKIAGNPNVNVKILEILAQDDWDFTLTQIACHQKTTPHIFRILAQKNNYFVNQVIADNPQAPPDILELIENFNGYDNDYASDIPF
jgi:TusA-related sulfurtransferase